MITDQKEKSGEVDELPYCPFCGGLPRKSKFSENVICKCLEPSNTWIPISVWKKRLSER